jgi:hypothetical protein
MDDSVIPYLLFYIIMITNKQVRQYLKGKVVSAKASCHKAVHGAWQQRYTFLASALVGTEFSASCPGSFIPRVTASP